MEIALKPWDEDEHTTGEELRGIVRRDLVEDHWGGHLAVPPRAATPEPDDEHAEAESHGLTDGAGDSDTRRPCRFRAWRVSRHRSLLH